MNQNKYCYWLLASIMAGNKITHEERTMLNNFLRPRVSGNR